MQRDNDDTIGIIYCRVSDPKQIKEGHGLESQETRCSEFLRYRNVPLVRVFKEEGVSGSIIDRPAMRDMLAFLRQQKRSQPKTKIIVVIDDISRLARDLRAHIDLRVAIQEAGGTLQSPSIEFGQDSDSQLVENMLASVSQHHRQKNAEQVKNRMRSRMLNGYWVLFAPRGYKVEKRGAHGKMLVPDEPLASIIREGIEGFAVDRFSTPVEVQAFFESQPCFPKDKKGRVHLQRVLDILNRQLYTGYYEYPEWNVPLMLGKHEPLVSFETFKQAQEKLQQRAKVPARKDISLDFPLRGFLLCDSCEVPMKSCWAHGRNGKYPYYLCQSKGCEHYGKSVRKEKIEAEFEQLLQSLVPQPQVVHILEKMVMEAHQNRIANSGAQRDELLNQKRLVERKVEQFLDRVAVADSMVLVTSYERQIKQLEEQRIMIDDKIKNCGRVDDRFEDLARTTFQFLANPHKYWMHGDLTGKRRLLKATFTHPLAYSRNKGYRTAALSLPFSVLREFSESDSKVVLAAGIEPALDYSKRILSPARLPVPPREHDDQHLTGVFANCKYSIFKFENTIGIAAENRDPAPRSERTFSITIIQI